jgi:hypothetical protein
VDIPLAEGFVVQLRAISTRLALDNDHCDGARRTGDITFGNEMAGLPFV